MWSLQTFKRICDKSLTSLKVICAVTFYSTVKISIKLVHNEGNKLALLCFASL